MLVSSDDTYTHFLYICQGHNKYPMGILNYYEIFNQIGAIFHLSLGVDGRLVGLGFLGGLGKVCGLI